MFEDIQNKKYTSSIQFQRMVLHLLLFSKIHYKQINTLIESRYFTLEPHQMIVAQYKAFVSQFGLKNNIDVDVLLNVFHKKADAVYLPIKNEIDTIRKTVVNNPEIVIEDIVLFAREQLAASAASDFMGKVVGGSVKNINESMKILQGNLSNIACLGSEGTDSFNFIEDIDKLSELFRIDTTINRLKTYIPQIDANVCGGHGLASGGVICVFAPSNMGKSTLLANMGAKNALNGKCVVHIGLCDADLSDYVGMYCSYFTKIDRNSLYSETNSVIAELYKREVDRLPGKLIIDSFQANELTTTKLNSYLDKLLYNKKIPKIDVLILDYMDKLQYDGIYSNKGSRDDTIIGYNYEALQKMGKDFGFGLLTASQVKAEAEVLLSKPHSTNPEDWKNGYIDRLSIPQGVIPEGSKQKINIPNVGLVLAQSSYELANNRMDIIMMRNRNGNKKFITTVDYRPETCYVEDIQNYGRQNNNNPY